LSSKLRDFHFETFYWTGLLPFARMGGMVSCRYSSIGQAVLANTIFRHKIGCGSFLFCIFDHGCVSWAAVKPLLR